MAKPARQLPEEDKPAIRPNLGIIQGHGQGDGISRGDLHNVDSGTVSESISRTALSTAEESSGMYNPEGDKTKSVTPEKLRSDEKAPSGGTEESTREESSEKPARRQRLKKTLKKASSHKLLIGGITLGGIAPILLIILLVLLISPYKLVDFAENMTAYQFARTTRQMSENTEAIINENVGTSIADGSLYARETAEYGTGAGQVPSLWTKINNLRPNKIIDNFEESGKLKFNYRTSQLGRQELESVTIGDSTSDITRGAVRNLIPGYNFASGVSFAKNFSPDLLEATKSNDFAPIIRGSVAAQVREEADISLTAWVIGRFLAKVSPDESPAQQDTNATTRAEEAEEQMSFDVGNAGDAAATIAGDTSLNAVAQQAQQAEDKDVASPEGIAAIVKDPNQLTLNLQDTINKGVSESGAAGAQGALGGVLGDILGVINPVYKVAVPLCLIYDGSITKAGSSIDYQTDQNERTGVLAATEADQEKDGSNVNNPAVQGADWKLQDTSNSNVDKRADGLPIDTSSYLSTEAAPTGYAYSLSDFLPAPLDTITKDIGGVCPVVTNLWVGVGLGVANVGTQAILDFFTGGAATDADAASTAAADAAVDETVPSIANQIIGKLASSGNALKDFGISAGKQITVIGALTIIAKEEVASQIGATHNTLGVGQAYDNDADSGMNQYSNQVDQQEFYAAPMTDADLNQDNSDDVKDLALTNSRKDSFERYLALDNPDSLVSHMGTLASGDLNSTMLSSLLSTGSRILNPLHAITSLFGSVLTHSSYAATPITSANTYYGNVQFGYTAAEKELMTTESYQPLVNQKILDESNEEATIAGIYGKCFDGSETIGTMLQNGDIQRDANGDVIADKGLCSPDNTGPDNTDTTDDPAGKGFGDLVFRWRVAEGYLNTADQLNGEATVTADPTVTSTTPTAAITIDKTAAQQAAQSASKGTTQVGYALYDSSGTQEASYNSTVENYGASITKSLILVAYLNQVGAGTLSAKATTDLTGMIEQSDDADANAVYKLLNNPVSQINAVANQAGMTGFKINESDPVYVLGQSEITASDFALFFAKINTMLPAAQKTFALNLLNTITPQAGLLDAGLPGTLYSKEGWKSEPDTTNPFGTEGAPYIVNQAAQFTNDGKTYGIAVTVSGTSDEQTGEATIESVVRALLPGQ